MGGKMARAAVFRGSKEKTTGGLTKATLVKSKPGKIVSKAASVRAKKAFATSGLKAWCDAVKAARKALNLTGFVAVGGKSATGKALYAKAKALLKWRRMRVRGYCSHWASSTVLRHRGYHEARLPA